MDISSKCHNKKVCLAKMLTKKVTTISTWCVLHKHKLILSVSWLRFALDPENYALKFVLIELFSSKWHVGSFSFIWIPTFGEFFGNGSHQLDPDMPHYVCLNLSEVVLEANICTTPYWNSLCIFLFIFPSFPSFNCCIFSSLKWIVLTNAELFLMW